MSKLLSAVAAVAAVAIGGYAAVALAGSATNDSKITICHVAGLASDPANHITLSLPPPAVFGPGGHFNENGTTQAGHEQDTMGPCQVEPPTTTGEEPPTTTGEEPPTTTGEEPPTTTGEEPPTTTSSEPPRGCPDGGPPNAGKDGQVPGSGNTNDDCDRSVPPSSTTTPTETGTTATTATTTTTETTPPPVVETSSTPPVTVNDEPTPDDPPAAKPKPRVSTKQCPAPAYMLDGECVRDYKGKPHPVAAGNG